MELINEEIKKWIDTEINKKSLCINKKIPFSASINDDEGNALQPAGSSTSLDIPLSIETLAVAFTAAGVLELFVAAISILAVDVTVFVTVVVNVEVAQMQVDGFLVTVTVTGFGTGFLHGSTTVTVVGKQDLVGSMIGLGGYTTENVEACMKY